MNILTKEEIEFWVGSNPTKKEIARAVEAAVLKKLAEKVDMKPAAYLKTWSSVDNTVTDKKRVDLTEDSGPWLATNSFPKIEQLYTETQLITAQLQVAKACVNLCKTLKGTENTQQHSQWNAGIDLCIDQLSSNEWMGHL